MAKTPSPVEKTTNQTTAFISMTLDMSWRLVIVVLVPIVIGSKLDSALGLKPALTIIGFFLAVIGTALVILAAVKKADAGIAKSRKSSDV